MCLKEAMFEQKSKVLWEVEWLTVVTTFQSQQTYTNKSSDICGPNTRFLFQLTAPRCFSNPGLSFEIAIIIILTITLICDDEIGVWMGAVWAVRIHVVVHGTLVHTCPYDELASRQMVYPTWRIAKAMGSNICLGLSLEWLNIIPATEHLRLLRLCQNAPACFSILNVIHLI